MIEIGTYWMEWWTAIAAIIVTVVGAARLTRILTYDAYPPAMKVRIWWDTVTKDGPWAKLAHCPWCAGPWFTLIAIVSFLVAALAYRDIPFLIWAWWFFWGWLTLSYWTSQYVHFDEGRDQDAD